MKNYEDRVEELILIQAVAEGCGGGRMSLGCTSIRTICRKLREERFKLQPPLTPIAGPPDLDGVADDALFVVDLFCNHINSPRMPSVFQCRTLKTDFANDPERKTEIIWHIPLGVITPPEPEVPKCRDCHNDMKTLEGIEDHWICFCSCASPFPAWMGSTEAKAIEAAKGGEA